MTIPAFKNLPLRNPHPNAEEFINILMGRISSSRVPLVEYSVSEVLLKPIITDILDRTWVPYGEDRKTQCAYWDNFIEFWYRLGYDFVRYEQGLPFRIQKINGTETINNEEMGRTWLDEHTGAITSWDDFEQYPWPSVDDCDLFPLEYISSHLPDGMGLMTCHGGGVFEHVSQIMSLEGICYALYEDPALVQAVLEKVGGIMEAFYKRLAELPNVIALFQGDDMGFVTGPLIGPEQLRTLFLPWLKRFADIAHGKGIPFFLHSCGNLETIMEPLISEVGIDAKHSFEDVIMPVEAFQANYGDRIAVLGGVDINRLTMDSPEQIRAHTRYLMETCGTRGRYAIGSGNSIPTYIPLPNYLAMIDEAVSFRL